MNNKCKLNKKGLEYINNSESMIENNLKYTLNNEFDILDKNIDFIKIKGIHGIDIVLNNEIKGVRIMKDLIELRKDKHYNLNHFIITLKDMTKINCFI